MEINTYMAIISIAFLASFSHCISMCGGFVLSYTAVKINNSWPKSYQAIMHLLYGLGRTLSYAILGGIFGYLGSIASVSMTYKGALFVILGIFMIILGISFIDKINITKYLKINLLELPIIKNIHLSTFKSQKAWSFFTFGMLNGFVPCGLVYFFISTSLINSSFSNGLIGMSLFGISTIPALFIVAFSAGILKSSLVRVFNYIASILIIGYGVITVTNGISMVNNTPMMDHSKMHHH